MGVILSLIIFVFGMIVGCFFTTGFCYTGTIGTLHIDTTDPDDGPYLFLELNKEVIKLNNKKHVILSVKTTPSNSHN